MAEPLRIALAGLGTVGAGLIRLVEANGALIARRDGDDLDRAAGTRTEASTSRPTSGKTT